MNSPTNVTMAAESEAIPARNWEKVTGTSPCGRLCNSGVMTEQLRVQFLKLHHVGKGAIYLECRKNPTEITWEKHSP